MPSPYRPYFISEIVQETEDIRSFVCTPADGQSTPEYKAGQFFMIRINDVPDLKPPMRSYSAARAYRPDRLAFGIKLHHNFTHALFGKKKGDKVEISGPYGFFKLADEGQAASAPIALLAAGIGITPLLSMAEELILKKDRRPISLFYSNRELQDAAFIKLLAGWAATNPNLKLISTLTCEQPPAGWEGECGRLSKDMLMRHKVDFTTTHFYFCGPKTFNDAMNQILVDAGVAKERIHREMW